MSGIYIHIPFCRQACNYCNFHFATSLSKKDAMLAAISKEIVLTVPADKWLVNTIYFGGGTPSLLEVEEIAHVLNTIKSVYKVDEGAEVTLEANPDDLTEERLEGWRAAGINRLSIGIQSFFEEDLQWMNRAHNAVQARKGLELALMYFDNITMDLIYGTPGLTNDKWQRNVEIALSLNIPHLSCYALTVEPKTPLDKLIRLNKKDDVNPDVQSEQFLLLMGWLRAAGYEHYEISNFAKPGFRSRHNSAYWQGKSYTGIGPSAHSFNGTERRWNIANNQQYIDAIEKGLLPEEKELLTPVQQINESIMISLRTIEGVDLTRFSEEAAQQLVKAVQKYINRELIIHEPNRLRLTDEGKLYADGIAADLFFDE